MAKRTRNVSVASLVAGKPDNGAANGSDNVTGSDVGGSGELGAIVIDPADISGGSDTHGNVGNDGDTGDKPRRGRPRGSTNKAKAVPLNVSGVETLLVGFHTMLAAMVSPVFALDTESKEFGGKSEAGYLAQSIADVAAHYDMGVFDKKTVDWLNLFQALGVVYGTRLFAAREARRAKVMPARPPVGPMPTQPPPQFHQPDAAAQTGPLPPFARDISKPNGAEPPPAARRTGEIPGIGTIEFPPDHALSGGRKDN